MFFCYIPKNTNMAYWQHLTALVWVKTTYLMRNENFGEYSNWDKYFIRNRT